MHVDPEWKDKNESKLTESLVWYDKVQKFQFCGPYIARNATDGILNAGKDTSILRVENVIRNPQVGTTV
jgi:hypothetical protein